MNAKRIALICTLVATTCTALIGQSHLVGASTEHMLTIVGLIGSNASSFFILNADGWDGKSDRRSSLNGTDSNSNG